jgi:hypothetical protein
MKKTDMIRKMLNFSAVFTFILLLLCMAGCGKNNSDQESGNAPEDSGEAQGSESEEEKPITAVYLKNDSDGELFVDLQNESPFFGQVPDEIYDENNEKIGKEDMQNGDVYLVYGDNIMLESYPGQYPGITKLVRREQANKEYIDKYAEYLAQFCPEPDTQNPPELTVEYSQPEAIVSAAASRGGYSWSVVLENGEAKSEIADSAHILTWDDELLIENKISGETKMTLHFTYAPQNVTVVRWPVSERQSSGSKDNSGLTEGEAVDVTEEETGFTFMAEPGYVYQVNGTWEEGTAEYGFYTSAIE